MGYEEDVTIERGSRSKPSVNKKMTLQEAIELGEYNPQFLATFPEWHSLSRHIQFQYIRKALDNRNQHLITQWAEICNILDFSKKPHLKTALENIEKQLKELEKDREILYLNYSS
jgi:hypothetical protein